MELRARWGATAAATGCGGVDGFLKEVPMMRTLMMCALLAALCAPAVAGVAIGDKAPDFMLFGVDYRYHTLERHKDAKAIVLVFTCNHCPVATEYEDPLIALAKAYQPKGVQFLAINANPADKVAADGFPQMIERAKEKDFPYPYVYDETQQVSRAYGATHTPHIFVLGPERTVVYMGAVDNRHEEPHYLANALDALLAGEEIAKPVTRQFGCTIKYRAEPKAETGGGEGA
jgi:peroxiredoxin